MNLATTEETSLNSSVTAKSTIDVVLAESYPMLLAGMDHILADIVDIRVVARCGDGEVAVLAV